MRALNFDPDAVPERKVVTALFNVCGEEKVIDVLITPFFDEDDDGDYRLHYNSDTEMREDPYFLEVIVDSDGTVADT